MKLFIKEGTKQIDSHQYEGRDDIEELIIADTVFPWNCCIRRAQ